MAKVAVTILARTPEEFAQRMERIRPFAERVHIDVADGVFTDGKTVGLAQAYDLPGVDLDLHLMLQYPESQFENILSLEPKLVILHAESEGDILGLFRRFREVDIKVGLALKPETSVQDAEGLIIHADHLLIFTGRLGYNGGEFQTDQLLKIEQARAIKSDLEIAVDGGINQVTARQAIEAGADVIDTGSFIHNFDDPQTAYDSLKQIAEGV